MRYDIQNGVLVEFVDDRPDEAKRTPDGREPVLIEAVVPDGVEVIGGGAFRSAYIGRVTLPESVRVISDEAFRDCFRLKEAVLPPRLRRIGDHAFINCYNLERITAAQEGAAPGTIVCGDIGVAAFAWCSGLKEITVIGKTIDDGAFDECGALERVSLQLEESIGYFAFNQCRSLREVVITGSIRTIGNHCFDGCPALERLSLPASLASMGEYAPMTLREDLKLYLSDLGQYMRLNILWPHALYIGGELVEAAAIPEGTSAIADRAFFNCSSLKSVTIPGSVRRIGESAFANCFNLESVHIPGSVETIGSNAFLFCISLEEAELAEGVKAIGESAFQFCDRLSDLTLPRSLEHIGEQTFDRCSRDMRLHIADLQRYMEADIEFPHYLVLNGEPVIALNLPEGISRIGSDAFFSCRGLTRLVIPASVYRIDAYAICHCRDLREVVIPEHTRVDPEAISECGHAVIRRVM